MNARDAVECAESCWWRDGKQTWSADRLANSWRGERKFRRISMDCAVRSVVDATVPSEMLQHLKVGRFGTQCGLAAVEWARCCTVQHAIV